MGSSPGGTGNQWSTILDAGRAAGDLRADISAEDIAASLIGIFTVVGKPGQHPQADRLLNLLMDGLRPRLQSSRSGPGDGQIPQLSMVTCTFGPPPAPAGRWPASTDAVASRGTVAATSGRGSTRPLA